jgi:hypothetical protein
MAKRITMQAAAAYWAKITGAPRPHRGTLIRWATKGVRGLRLEAEPLAGRWYTTTDAVEEFHRRMVEPVAVGAAHAGTSTRAAQMVRAVDELDEMLERKSVRRSPK